MTTTTTGQSLPSITRRTFEMVKDLMNRDGFDSNNSDEVALYVERLIARDQLFRTVDKIRQKTALIPEEELQQIIDEAVEEAKAIRRGQAPSADPS